MKRIVFRYKDDWSKGEWKTQECVVESVEECKKIYGLGIDPTCEYEIISVEEVGGKTTRLPVRVNPLYLKRKKLELIRDIEGWESAEEDSEEEKEWEDRMRYDLARVTEWEKKWGEYETVQELKFWLKEEMKNA